MKNHWILLTLISIMFILCSNHVSAEVIFNDSSTSYANLSEYTYTRNYGFETLITNTTVGGVSTVDTIQYAWFELTRVGASASNFTPSTTPAVTNDTTGRFYINFTQDQLGRACNGTHLIQYRWFANETLGEENVTTSLGYFVNRSNSTGTYMNISRREYPTGTEYFSYSSGVNLSYSSPISQNITGWYDSRFDGETITFTLYRGTTSIGTSNPQSSTRDYTDQTDAWSYYNADTVNYSSYNKSITVTYTGGVGGGGGGSEPPSTNIPCPYECCMDDGQHMDKMCADGTCINHNCIVGVTTTPIVTTIPSGYDLPIIGNVKIGMNTKFIALMVGAFISLMIFIGLIYIVVK